MNCLSPISKFFLAALAALAGESHALGICTLGAARLIEMRQSLSWTPARVDSTGRQMTIDFIAGGDTACHFDAAVLADLDQEAVRTLARRTFSGPVLFARGEIIPGGARLRLTGDEDVISSLARIYHERRTLFPYVRGLRLRILANYVVTFEVGYAGLIHGLANQCREEPLYSMACARYAPLAARAEPSCLKRAGNYKDFVRGLVIDDPYVGDQDPEVRIRAVTRNLCHYAIAQAPYPAGLAHSVLFEKKGYRGPESAAVLSQIEFGVNVVW